MSSCCICGLVLAPIDHDYPAWCKKVRAICWFEERAVLTGEGSVDDDSFFFSLPIHSEEVHHFIFTRRSARGEEDFCYPFHSACWALLLEAIGGEITDREIATLFSIFDSIHCSLQTLRWGHNYLFEEIASLTKQHVGDIVATFREDRTILVDPLEFALFQHNFEERLSLPWLPISSEDSTSTRICRGRILTLPSELVESIMFQLDFCDVHNLLQATSGCIVLSPAFWTSRFWPCGEAGFAKSIRPPTYSWKDWFFSIQLQLGQGLHKSALRNRKRIWRLGLDLVNLVRVLEAPDRVRYGNIDTANLHQIRGPTASCVALKFGREGCKELDVVYVPLENGVHSLIPSYIVVSGRQVVCGLSFMCSNGESVDAGYVSRTSRDDSISKDSSKLLWLVSSPLGFEFISLDVCPEKFLDTRPFSDTVAIARWKLENLKGIHLGLDAMRIVRISIDVQKDITRDDLSWTAPYPSYTPNWHLNDITALDALQKASFAPASTHSIDTTTRRLVAIKVYGPLGWRAGVTGVVFAYDIGVESVWGSINDAASVTFFVGEEEKVVKAVVYMDKSVVFHIQFTTNHSRTSELLPPLPQGPATPLECVAYEVSNKEPIEGFCGCFTGPMKRLHCFGIRSTAPAVSSRSAWLSPVADNFPTIPGEIPLRGVGNHGQHQSHLRLSKNYQSVQASVNFVVSKHRRVGQVTGLLFRSRDNAYPDLLGQLTGLGDIYDLEEDEEIVDLQFTTARPISLQRSRIGLSQVEGITVVTNRRKFSWGPKTSGEVGYRPLGPYAKTKEVTWVFNAIFDRITLKR